VTPCEGPGRSGKGKEKGEPSSYRVDKRQRLKETAAERKARIEWELCNDIRRELGREPKKKLRPKKGHPYSVLCACVTCIERKTDAEIVEKAVGQRLDVEKSDGQKDTDEKDG
jgi:hypothetical protein